MSTVTFFPLVTTYLFLTTICLSDTFTVTFSSTLIPPSPTSMPLPGGACLFDGQVYEDGASISQDADGCYGTMCQSGAVVAWDHKCMFYTPQCAGVQIDVPGQCCPECLSTTPPPTTTMPTTTPLPPNACVYNGKLYQNGDEIQRDSNNCGGSICQDGQVVYWDHRCMFYTPPCAGISYPIPGECCPGCNLTTTLPTTIPTTSRPQPSTNTTIAQNDCLHNGQVYRNYDRMDVSPDGCHGYECHYGVVRPWKYPCHPDPTAECNGTVVDTSSDCCPQCVPTTTPGTNTTAITDVQGTSAIDTSEMCSINSTLYHKGAITKKNGCDICKCGDNGQEICKKIQCPVLDCEGARTRYEGECCFTCGASPTVAVWWTLVLTTVLTIYWH